MPLNQFRNYQALVNLVPGAVAGGFQNAETDTPARSLATNVNGQAINSNATRTDGATNVNIWLPSHQMYGLAGRDDRHGQHLDQQLRRRAGHGWRRRDHGRHQVGHEPVQGVGVRVLQQRQAQRDRRTTSAATAGGQAGQAAGQRATSSAAPSAGRSRRTSCSSSDPTRATRASRACSRSSTCPATRCAPAISAAPSTPTARSRSSTNRGTDQRRRHRPHRRSRTTRSRPTDQRDLDARSTRSSRAPTCRASAPAG